MIIEIKHNTHETQMKILRLLEQLPTITYRQISKALNVSLTTVFHHIRQLEKKDYIRKLKLERGYEIRMRDPKIIKLELPRGQNENI